MKRIFIVLCLAIALVLFLTETSVNSFTSPLESPILQELGATVIPPDIQNDKSIDSQDVMLNLVKLKRFWPIGEPDKDGCILFHTLDEGICLSETFE